MTTDTETNTHTHTAVIGDYTKNVRLAQHLTTIYQVVHDKKCCGR